MNTTDKSDAPRAEAGRHLSGASTGGALKSADQGLSNSMQRSAERADVATPDAASAGARGHGMEDVSEAAVSGAAASVSGAKPRATPRSTGFDDEDEGDEPSPRARPDADEPRHESAAESFGRSISQVITGPTHENPVEPTAGKPKSR